jgi:hypothetical protein
MAAVRINVSNIAVQAPPSVPMLRLYNGSFHADDGSSSLALCSEPRWNFPTHNTSSETDAWLRHGRGVVFGVRQIDDQLST